MEQSIQIAVMRADMLIERIIRWMPWMMLFIIGMIGWSQCEKRK